MRITDKIKKVLSLIGELFDKCIDNLVPEFVVVISFYASFSYALLLLIIVKKVYEFGNEVEKGEISNQIDKVKNMKQ